MLGIVHRGWTRNNSYVNNDLCAGPNAVATLISNGMYNLDGYGNIELQGLYYSFNQNTSDIRIKIQQSGGTWQTVASARWSCDGNYKKYTLNGDISGYSGMYKIMIEISVNGYGEIRGPVSLIVK